MWPQLRVEGLLARDSLTSPGAWDAWLPLSVRALLPFLISTHVILGRVDVWRMAWVL